MFYQTPWGTTQAYPLHSGLNTFLVIPLVATAFSYSRVLKVVRQHLTGISPSLRGLGGNDARISIQEIRLSRSLFIVIFTFLACWVPLWFIVIMRRFSLVSHMPRNMELLCMFFLYVSNTVNPLIYAGMNSIFRSEFRRILFSGSMSLCACTQRKNEQQEHELGPVTSK